MVRRRQRGAKEDTDVIRARLLDWYDRSRRDLPWRRDPTPYRVWISEVMLQQTRVDVVIPRYLAFLERFPDVAALASAPSDDVLAAWSGLGYYSRARSLHAAAREIAARHAGEFPRDPEAARALPGVGPYTRAAVLSIAYGVALPVLDGNVHRVLARLFRRGGDPRTGPVSRGLEEIAEELLSPERPGDFNQALMELGALVCLPAAPRCLDCPLASACAAREAGDVLRYPERAPSRAPEEVRLAAALVHRGPLWLLERAGPDAPYLRGLWGFPIGEASEDGGAQEVARRLESLLGGRLHLEGPAGAFRHSITYRRITLTAWRFALEARTSARGEDEVERDGWGWYPLARLGKDLAASSLFLKVKRFLESGPDEPRGVVPRRGSQGARDPA